MDIALKYAELHSLSPVFVSDLNCLDSIIYNKVCQRMVVVAPANA